MFWSAFRHGIGPFWDAISSPDAVAALKLTLITAAIAVPANAIFGLLAAHVIVRRRFPGRRTFSALIDLPLALSPVVVGLALVLVWGRGGMVRDVGNRSWRQRHLRHSRTSCSQLWSSRCRS